jgi:hypothetical protein
VYVYMPCCVIRCPDLTDLARGFLRRGLGTGDDGMDGMWSILQAAYIFHTMIRLGIQPACVSVCVVVVVVVVVGILRRECARRSDEACRYDYVRNSGTMKERGRTGGPW